MSRHKMKAGIYILTFSRLPAFTLPLTLGGSYNFLVRYLLLLDNPHHNNTVNFFQLINYIIINF